MTARCGAPRVAKIVIAVDPSPVRWSSPGHTVYIYIHHIAIPEPVEKLLIVHIGLSADG